MCSLSSSMRSISGGMENNYQGGDLTDILRAGGSDHHQAMINSDTTASWHFSSVDDMKFSSSTTSMELVELVDDVDPSSCRGEDNFGDPFSSYIRDPLLRELSSSSTSAGFFTTTPTTEMNMTLDVEEAPHHPPYELGHHHHHHHHQAAGEVVATKNNNIFSRLLQISPGKLAAGGSGDVMAGYDNLVAVLGSPRGGGGIKAGPGGGGVMVGSDMINANSSKGCLLENTGVQISSPRNPGGIKRRKSQAKKVVCIPAPAAANSRPTGEVVPSDLWAWRKYGQKPIKGSPYPRGYYRCSSSKGCSARKQVERSRTDPNMLVITYTSEHNHPWPTQRNALAGSTRSQPSKSGSNKAGSSAAAHHHHHHQQKPNSPAKEEQKAAHHDSSMINENNNNNHVLSPVVGTTSSSAVKEEEFDHQDNIENSNSNSKLQLDYHHHHDHGQFSNHDQGFPAYRPSMPPAEQQQSTIHSEDFFADLGEIEADPLNLLFSQCFTADEQQKGSTGAGGGNINKQQAAAALDPFNLFDWTSEGAADHQNNNIPSFGTQEAKRHL